MQAGALEVMADALYRRLVAHEFYLDAPALTALGSGALVMDLRHGLCRHGQHWIPPLLTVARLRRLLPAELARADLPVEELLVAEVRLQVRLAPQKGGRNSKMT